MKLTESQYYEHCDSYDGYCTKCDDITREGMTEPDARRYHCEECGNDTVYGIEEAMMMGYLEIR